MLLPGGGADQVAHHHVAVLPRAVSFAGCKSTAGRSLLRLPHPRTAAPILLLPYQTSSGADALLEIQKISGGNCRRSWFLSDAVVADGSLTVFTPFDPVFLLIAFLSGLPPVSHFMAAEDLFDRVEAVLNVEADDMKRLANLSCTITRLASICESQNHEGTLLYRYCSKKALEVLRIKISRLSSPTEEGVFGDYKSDSLVSDSDPPRETSTVKGLKRQRSFSSLQKAVDREGVGDGKGLSYDLQLELRQKATISIISNYLPPGMSEALSQSYPFTALATAHAEQTPSSSSFLSTTYLPGRASVHADDSLPSRYNPGHSSSSDNGAGKAAREKKKKLEAQKGSRGVEILKKASKRGMKNLADMFGAQTKKLKPEASTVATIAASVEEKFQTRTPSESLLNLKTESSLGPQTKKRKIEP